MIDLYKYRLPFISPFHIADMVFNHREGFFLHYHDSDYETLTEIAPLPGFSDESMSDAQECLTDHLTQIHELLYTAETLPGLSADIQTLNLLPSVQFGVSTAGISLLAQRAHTSIHQLLGFELSRKILVNAAIGIRSKTENLLEQIDYYNNQGYRTLKLKCGDPPGFLPEAIGIAASRHPDLLFRIDANRSWPVNKAKEYFNQFRNCPVEYFEEPFAFTDFEQHRMLQGLSNVPIALDESVRTKEDLEHILSKQPAEILVIKPMLYGNVIELFETIRRHYFSKKNAPAHTIENDHKRSNKTALKIDLVCSTSFETGIGRRIHKYITGMIGAPERAHGLDTGRLFKVDFMPDGIQHGVCYPESSSDWGVDFSHCNPDLLVHLTSHEI